MSIMLNTYIPAMLLSGDGIEMNTDNELEIKTRQIEKLEALAWAIKALDYKTDSRQIAESIDKILELGKENEITTIN